VAQHVGRPVAVARGQIDARGPLEEALSVLVEAKGHDAVAEAHVGRRVIGRDQHQALERIHRPQRGAPLRVLDGRSFECPDARDPVAEPELALAQAPPRGSAVGPLGQKLNQGLPVHPRLSRLDRQFATFRSHPGQYRLVTTLLEPGKCA